MRKTIMLALALVASATFCQAYTGPKKEKKKKKGDTTIVAEPVKLTSATDSISYALGMDATNGLVPFLIQQLHVDTAYMPKFIEGFQATLDKEQNKKELTAYSAGVQIANMVEERMIPNASKQLGGAVDSISADLFYKGFLAWLKKDSTLFTNTTAQKYVVDTRETHSKKLRMDGEKFLTENAIKPGVNVTHSRLQYKGLQEGHGQIATKDDEVEVNYEAKLVNGTIFDSSYQRNPQTTKFKPTQVIKGWTEALTMMPEGSIWELYIPQNLAYGERGAGEIPPFSTLIFKVEVVKVNKKQEATK